MKFSYNWLKEFLPNLPPPKKTANLLTMHAFEVGEVYRDQGDWVFDIDILPNRMPDASSHEGIARELRAILSVQSGKAPAFRSVQPKLREEKKQRASSLLAVRIEDRDGCLLYAGRIVTDVRVATSPTWFQKRLRTSGLEPINNIVDAANYVMLELGQPLHAFDLDKIARTNADTGQRRSALRQRQSATIVVRKAKKGERITTLDGGTRELPPFATVIADNKKPLAIAGIKGGDAAAITVNTTSIVLEAALFSPSRIYKTSRALGLATDASRRFEAGRSAQDVTRALDRLAQRIVQIAGGNIARGRVVTGKAAVTPRGIPFSREYASKLLGMDISEKQARKVFDALHCRVAAQRGTWAVIPPPHRLDLLCEEDLTEEVGRLIGYEHIPVGRSHALMGLVEIPLAHQWAERVRDILAGAGFNETMRLSFVNANLLNSSGFASDKAVTVENPQSSELSLLRPSLLPRLLAQAEESRRVGAYVRLFETGHVFDSDSSGNIRESQRLGIVYVPQQGARAFFELKGVVQDLCERLGVADVSWAPLVQKFAPWHPGKTAEVFIGGKFIGFVGELAVRKGAGAPLLEGFGVIAAAELNLDLLEGAASEEHEYRAPSRYPEVVRDIAVFVSYDTAADFVEQEIVRVGKSLLRDVDVLDEHFDDRFPEGMKSLAFRLFYQSNTKTLTSQEVDALHKKIEEALRARGWEAR